MERTASRRPCILAAVVATAFNSAAAAEPAPQEIEVSISPAGSVSENGMPVTATAAFKNVSGRPVVLLGARVADQQGQRIEKEEFLGMAHRSKARGVMYHRYNLLPPSAVEHVSLETSGRPGSYRLEFALEYLVADSRTLQMPVYEMVKSDQLKRNPPDYASLDEYGKRTKKTRVGTLASVWKTRRASTEDRGQWPYFVDVSAAMLKQKKTRRVTHELTIKPDPDIQALLREHPGVNDYRSEIPHFGVVFRESGDTYVKDGKSYKKLGLASFEAVEHVGRCISRSSTIRLSVGRRAGCLQRVFKGRIKRDDRPLGQAMVIGQGMPVVDIKATELDVVWKCMREDRAHMSLSQYYQYLVVER